MNRHPWILLIALAIGLAGSPALSQTAGAPPTDPELIEKIRRSNAECYECHSEQGLKNPPRKDMDLKKLGALLVDHKTIDASIHGGMECKTCHGAGYAKFPHAETAREQISPCGECHARKVFKIEKEIEKSIHTKSEKGDKFTCNTCHDPHVYRTAAKIVQAKSIVIQDNAFCMDCHESELRYAEFAKEAKRLPKMDTVHAWLPNPERHWGAVRCVDCHTPVGKTVSHEIQKKDVAEKQCVSCHTRDSALRTRLYRHLVQEERVNSVGFVNAAILTDAYVIGATRNEYLDFAAIALVGLTVAALGLHGLMRVVGRMIVRRRRTDHV